VILNNEYLKILSFKKLKLDTFFLGFSFPLSLITMSVMFSFMKDDLKQVTRVLKNIGFWVINLGVITFFMFILFERLGLQLVITTVLFMTVIMIFYLFDTSALQMQQKSFLISGMIFLLLTAVTGIFYIILEFFPAYYTPDTSRLLLKIHSFASLYGWNLSGLSVICRYEDFPIRLHSKKRDCVSLDYCDNAGSSGSLFSDCCRECDYLLYGFSLSYFLQRRHTSSPLGYDTFRRLKPDDPN
jgi:hypothetical protein